MKIRCIAIDDEPLALKQLAGYIRDIPSLDLVSECSNAFQALKVLDSEEVDLMFVDINMPDLNGLDFVRSLENKPLLIFTTAYSEFAIEGFKVDALDYLLKPFSFTEFSKAVNKVVKQMALIHNQQESAESNDSYLFIRSEYKLVRINFDDIKFVEGMKEYVRIHLTGQKPVMTLLSLKSLENTLPTEKFMRVHRSYIVNTNKISVVERNRIIYDDKFIIPVSDQYKEKFQKYIDRNFMG